jgi:hypothetical protein
LICSGLSIANPFINAVGTKDHEDVLFKMPRLGSGPGTEVAESGAWKKLKIAKGCALEIPRRGVLDPTGTGG